MAQGMLLSHQTNEMLKCLMLLKICKSEDDAGSRGQPAYDRLRSSHNALAISAACDLEADEGLGRLPESPTAPVPRRAVAICLQNTYPLVESTRLTCAAHINTPHNTAAIRHPTKLNMLLSAYRVLWKGVLQLNYRGSGTRTRGSAPIRTAQTPCNRVQFGTSGRPQVGHRTNIIIVFPAAGAVLHYNTQCF